MTRSGITVQALRRHRWAFLGPAAVQTTAAAVVSAMIMISWSVNRAPLTKAQRHELISPDVGDMTGVFIGVAVELSILMVGVAMNLVISGQARDIALLRAIGAKPAQIRRSAAAQAAVVAVPSSVAGYLIGTVLGAVWTSALRGHGILPPQIAFHPHVLALPIVAGIGIGTSVLGALAAAIRPSLIRPAKAMTDSATGRPRIGVIRTGLGLILVIGGTVLAFVVARLNSDKANDSAFFVLLALCIGVGLLGPVILKTAVMLTRPLTRLLGGSGTLAADGVASMSRPLSGALVPLVLAIGFALVKVAMHTTSAHVTGTADAPADVWLDYAGTGIYGAFAAIAALNTLVTVMARRRRDLAVTRLAGADRRRLLGVVGIEAAIVLGTALVLAAAVGGLTLAPMLHTQLHVWLPYLPPAYLVAGFALAAAVVAAGMVAAAAAFTRRPAIQVVGAVE